MGSSCAFGKKVGAVSREAKAGREEDAIL